MTSADHWHESGIKLVWLLIMGFFIDFSSSSKNWGKSSVFRHLSWQYIALIFQVYVASQGETRINMQRHTLPTVPFLDQKPERSIDLMCKFD